VRNNLFPKYNYPMNTDTFHNYSRSPAFRQPSPSETIYYSNSLRPYNNIPMPLSYNYPQFYMNSSPYNIFSPNANSSSYNKLSNCYQFSTGDPYIQTNLILVAILLLISMDLIFVRPTKK